jgi:hypothetical protein
LNKSIDSRKITEISNKKSIYRKKKKRNLSSDNDFTSNYTPDKLFKIYNKNELKNKYLYHIVKKSHTLSNRSQNIDNNKTIKSNNSKFNLRNNSSLYDFSNKFNKLKINAHINDNIFNYLFMPKTNKSSERNYYKNKFNINSVFENNRNLNLNNSSNKKINNDSGIYKKIMKNFYNCRKNKNINTNVHYQNIYGKNNGINGTRRTDYKLYNYNKRKINYSISNNINNNINSININTSNNLINFITNITSCDDYHSLSGNASRKKSMNKKNAKHNIINSNNININDSCTNKRIIKKDNNDFSNKYNNKLNKLYTIDSKCHNKKNSLDVSANNNNIRNRIIKNENQTITTINNNKNKTNKNLHNYRNIIKKINKINHIETNFFKNTNYDNKNIKNCKQGNINIKNKICYLNSEGNNTNNKRNSNKYNYLNDNKSKVIQ